MAKQPSVGIFWQVDGQLVVDGSPLDTAEEYGDCLTHAIGHYDRWQKWQAMGYKNIVSAGYPAAILSTEYDEWPRGRVVYEKPNKLFVVYADRHLQNEAFISALKSALCIENKKSSVKSDLHYRTSKPL